MALALVQGNTRAPGDIELSGDFELRPLPGGRFALSLGPGLTASPGNHATTHGLGGADAVAIDWSQITSGTGDVALISGIQAGDYTVPLGAVEDSGSNGVALVGTGGTLERLANGGAGTVLRGGTAGGGSTNMSFGQISDSHVAVGAGIASSKISGLATVATSGSAADLTGSLADARLSSNVPLKNAANTFTEGQTISKGQNGSTQLDIINTTDGTASLAGFRLQSDNNAAGSSRRLKFQLFAESHSTSLFAGKMVLGSDNVPILLFNPSLGTTTGLDEKVEFTFGTTANILTLIRKETTSRKILSIFGSTPTDTAGDGVIAVHDRTAAPTSSLSGGFLMSSNSGVPTFRTSGGKILNLDQAAAYTQTYSTASRTVATLTAAALSGITSSSAGTVLAEPSAGYVQAEHQQNYRRLMDVVNAIITDITSMKQNDNALIDDSQARGFAA